MLTIYCEYSNQGRYVCQRECHVNLVYATD